MVLAFGIVKEEFDGDILIYMHGVQTLSYA